MSDGTATLRFLDPKTTAEIGSVRVNDGGVPVRRLNELEYVHDEVWANIWYRDQVVRIDPDSGQVLGYVDLGHLWPAKKPRRSEQVLNGIAYDPENNQLLVTGKRWPWLYQIDLPERMK
jgi:glutaminyl-peptide cyclotransferase